MTWVCWSLRFASASSILAFHSFALAQDALADVLDDALHFDDLSVGILERVGRLEAETRAPVLPLEDYLVVRRVAILLDAAQEALPIILVEGRGPRKGARGLRASLSAP